MARKGLNYEDIIKVAVMMVEEKGDVDISLRELAGRLGVQPSSLYNHVTGIGDIQTAVGKYGIDRMEQILLPAIEGKSMDDALRDLAHAYRKFARERPGLYEALIELKTFGNPTLVHELHRIIRPFFAVLKYELTNEEKIVHYGRIYRGMLHGMVSMENNGYMVRTDVPLDDTFAFMIEQYIKMVHQEIDNRGNE